MKTIIIHDEANLSRSALSKDEYVKFEEKCKELRKPKALLFFGVDER